MGDYNGDTIEQIRKLNPDIADLDHLKAGQVIRFPWVAEPAPFRGSQWGSRQGREELSNELSRMSKNFELLQRVAKDEFFSVPEEPVPVPQKAPALVSVQKEPADLEIPKLVPLRKEPPDPEITKLVQRLFLQAGKEQRTQSRVLLGDCARRPKQLDLRASGRDSGRAGGHFRLHGGSQLSGRRNCIFICPPPIASGSRKRSPPKVPFGILQYRSAGRICG